MNKRESKKVEKAANYPAGYWPSVLAEAQKVLKSDKRITADVAYQIARNNVDNVIPQMKLFQGVE